MNEMYTTHNKHICYKQAVSVHASHPHTDKHHNTYQTVYPQYLHSVADTG